MIAFSSSISSLRFSERYFVATILRQAHGPAGRLPASDAGPSGAATATSPAHTPGENSRGASAAPHDNQCFLRRRSRGED